MPRYLDSQYFIRRRIQRFRMGGSKYEWLQTLHTLYKREVYGCSPSTNTTTRFVTDTMLMKWKRSYCKNRVVIKVRAVVLLLSIVCSRQLFYRGRRGAHLNTADTKNESRILLGGIDVSVGESPRDPTARQSPW